jgi:hypothetical protein
MKALKNCVFQLGMAVVLMHDRDGPTAGIKDDAVARR